MQRSINILEKDSTGRHVQSYILTSKTDSTVPVTRLDTVPSGDHTSTDSSAKSIVSNLNLVKLLTSSPKSLITSFLFPLFLPHGYPHTVTPDYTPYQIYDSFQAFASTIAGLLSSRAVLQSLGFDESSASAGSTATYATLLNIAQSTISNATTILYAHEVSQRISANVKYYRFLADIANDAGFIIQCLSPSLPQYARAPALCLGSAFRAVCGVAGGSSKAVLSAHFALNGNIGELNAKDGSQETVINLVGMWVGGLIVSRVSSFGATWGWVLGLIGMHLWLNYCAVRAVRLRSLNGYRAGVVLAEIASTGRCPTVNQIGDNEPVFCRTDVLRRSSNETLGYVRMGVGMTQVVRAIGAEDQIASGSLTAKHEVVPKLLRLFEKEHYVMWFCVQKSTAYILLKENANIEDQLRAWYLAMQIASSTLNSGDKQTSNGKILDTIADLLPEIRQKWDGFRALIGAAGWDLSASSIEEASGSRFSFS